MIGVCSPPFNPNLVSSGGSQKDTNRTSYFMQKQATQKEGKKPTWLDFVRVTLHDVEGSATLKQREMNLDDAIVDDTPPSKQVCETSSGNRTPMR
ncbi:hypothetical protein RHGRI_037565 [Rhododendron griersonianum]|uniref:Uncharacterized protein n=1 Tax=Rhododendron griersonianum TaxID=479676 RepID=A0AAV6HW62_9ERIC|nr:hypothetical protein RHGRI_037565 [Rhododendron griersonianum]